MHVCIDRRKRDIGKPAVLADQPRIDEEKDTDSSEQQPTERNTSRAQRFTQFLAAPLMNVRNRKKEAVVPDSEERLEKSLFPNKAPFTLSSMKDVESGDAWGDTAGQRDIGEDAPESFEATNDEAYYPLSPGQSVRGEKNRLDAYVVSSSSSKSNETSGKEVDSAVDFRGLSSLSAMSAPFAIADEGSGEGSGRSIASSKRKDHCAISDCDGGSPTAAAEEEVSNLIDSDAVQAF